MLCHIQYIRELLDKGIIQYLFWIDTRDMVADGLTKGAVDRNTLHALMDGVQTLQHEYEQWKSKQLMRLVDDPKSSETLAQECEGPQTSLLRL